MRTKAKNDKEMVSGWVLVKDHPKIFQKHLSTQNQIGFWLNYDCKANSQLKVSEDKTSIEIKKSKKELNFLNNLWSWLMVNYINSVKYDHKT